MSVRAEFAEVTQVTEYGRNVIKNLRFGFDALAAQLELVATPGRLRSLAMTKLEEACMFAVKAIATAHELEGS